MKVIYSKKPKCEEKERNHVRKYVRICISCGNPNVEEYEFGISCERCGSSFYFEKIFEDVN